MRVLSRVRDLKPCPTSKSAPVTQLMKLDFPAPVCPITAIKTDLSSELSNEDSESSDPSLESSGISVGVVWVADVVLSVAGVVFVADPGFVIVDAVSSIAVAVFITDCDSMVADTVPSVVGAVFVAGALSVAVGFTTSAGLFETVVSSFVPPSASEGKL